MKTLSNNSVQFNSKKFELVLEMSGFDTADFIKITGKHPATLSRWIERPPSVEILVQMFLMLGFTLEEIGQIKIGDFFFLYDEEGSLIPSQKHELKSLYSGVPEKLLKAID